MIDRFDFSVGGIALLHFKSGDISHVFSMDPSLAKKLGKGLLQTIEKIEKANNITFDDRLDNEPMKSPVQIKPIDGDSTKK